MDNTIIAASIGALGVVIGSLITAFKKDLFTLLDFRKSNKDLEGTWSVRWFETNGKSEEKILEEKIIIDKINKGKIQVKVKNTSNVSYNLLGKIHNNNTITLEFLGMENHNAINGVIALIIHMNRKEMNGVWLQPYNNDFIIGKTYWTKE
ncbi:hypothetical protein [Tenacibaculum agarivorans]|uniref:hypothetical protein n=1 Tax=Tenacibaculum agarivorans TaxID=1908389 RepID=UPI00094BB4D3|nr:hypothetical protein [Tenacibaculum agarivorans]